MGALGMYSGLSTPELMPAEYSGSERLISASLCDANN